MTAAALIVNDVTQLNPIRVMGIAVPESLEELRETIRRTSGRISIGGGRYSMGGQTASPGSLHIDMRSMNRILAFSPEHKTIRVQSGVRWSQIQAFVDSHDLSVKIMQTYANFTVGGALSVNCHGRYVGFGPVVLSVRAITLVMADGEVIEASRSQNPELFHAAIGGYGAIGIIAEAELDLADNRRVKRIDKVMPLGEYWRFFRDRVRNNPRAVFTNADLYGPDYSTLRSVTWEETDDAATTPDRLQKPRKSYPLERYFLWSMTEMPFGPQRRKRYVDPLLYLSSKVHWRNYEAGYDVAELEPPSRVDRTYVLQEYFVPVEQLEVFVASMGEILRRHRVNALNISIRHAMPDPHTVMSWAPVETFAFVLYHKQRTRHNARERVGVWTRELIDAVLAVGGRYYLPYQPHATVDQFHRAYPGAPRLFELKRRVDPQARFTNSLWDKYCPDGVSHESPSDIAAAPATDFHRVFGDPALRDDFYRFLQVVFRTVPEDRFHWLIADACQRHRSEEVIYRHLQRELPTATPRLADLTHALPALGVQKTEMASQTAALLGQRRSFDGYAEIGSKGRYVRALRKRLDLRGALWLVDAQPPGFAPPDVVERGQLSRLGRHVPLRDFEPLGVEIADASLDLVSCFIGLHHMTPAQLGPFLASVARVMRPGGVFLLRDHDVTSDAMRAMVALAHTVFNARLGETWETNHAELRHFAPIGHWVAALDAAGFDDLGHRVLQANDPTDNTLLAFQKRAA
ncbi:hypothetical protein BH09PSE6_BH09PSE6_20590 [soil metagenome]